MYEKGEKSEGGVGGEEEGGKELGSDDLIWIRSDGRREDGFRESRTSNSRVKFSSWPLRDFIILLLSLYFFL
jgi:hypothetical protein